MAASRHESEDLCALKDFTAGISHADDPDLKFFMDVVTSALGELLLKEKRKQKLSFSKTDREIIEKLRGDLDKAEMEKRNHWEVRKRAEREWRRADEEWQRLDQKVVEIRRVKDRAMDEIIHRF